MARCKGGRRRWRERDWGCQMKWSTIAWKEKEGMKTEGGKRKPRQVKKSIRYRHWERIQGKKKQLELWSTMMNNDGSGVLSRSNALNAIRRRRKEAGEEEKWGGRTRKPMRWMAEWRLSASVHVQPSPFASTINVSIHQHGPDLHTSVSGRTVQHLHVCVCVCVCVLGAIVNRSHTPPPQEVQSEK